MRENANKSQFVNIKTKQDVFFYILSERNIILFSFFTFAYRFGLVLFGLFV